MTVFVGFLRAVNVGGTGRLAMSELVALCVGLGYADVRTYIQSGNVVFSSGASSSEGEVRSALEVALAGHMGKPVDVIVRTADDLAGVVEANPFAGEEPSKVAVVLSGSSILADLLEGFVAPGVERLVLAEREMYVHYPDGMGRSKLKLPATGGPVTARNINTMTKLVAMTRSSR